MKTHAFAALAVALLPVVAEAQATKGPLSHHPLGFSVGVDAVSTYAFRGVDVTDGVALQPWAAVAVGGTGLSVGAWGSWALDRDAPLPYSPTLTRGDADEIDLTVSFSRPTGPVSVSAGYIAYVYPGLDYTTQEVYAGVGLPAVPLTLTAFYDFDGTDDPARNPDTVEGAYVALSARQRIDVGTLLDAAASVGWTNQNALRVDPGMNDAAASLAAPIAVGPVTVTPAVGWSHLFDGSSYAAGVDDTWWVKLQVKLSR